MEFCNDFRYDLRIGNEAENEFAQVLQDSTIELKYDLKCKDTGNIYIEYESRGKPSGIATSKADFWVYKLDNGTFIVKKRTDLLKRLKWLMDFKQGKMGVQGGDDNTSRGFLVKYRDIL